MGYLRKLGLCLLTGVTMVIVLQRIGYRLSWEWGGHRYPRMLIVIVGGALIVLAAIVYSAVWHRKEAVSSPAPGSLPAGSAPEPAAVWQGLLAGFIALDLAMFGWQKLFHQQFIVPIGRLDEPFNSFSPEDLTWAYFHASYAFTCVIALCQIAGSFLLFTPRTRLLGAILLLPVLVNIVLIDLFYGFERGVTAHAVILLIGLLYLILVHYRRLAALFFPRDGAAGVDVSVDKAPQGRVAGGYMLPVAAAVVLPLLLVWSFGSPDHHPQLTGKYRVLNLRVAGVGLVAGPCGDSVLTSVIFDVNDEMVLEFNSLQRRWIGSYRLDPGSGSLVASWRFPAVARDTLVARVDRDRSGAWRLRGSLGKVSLQALLVRSEPPAGLQR